jgi:hypothetical protein
VAVGNGWSDNPVYFQLFYIGFYCDTSRGAEEPRENQKRYASSRRTSLFQDMMDPIENDDMITLKRLLDNGADPTSNQYHV